MEMILDDMPRIWDGTTRNMDSKDTRLHWSEESLKFWIVERVLRERGYERMMTQLNASLTPDVFKEVLAINVAKFRAAYPKDIHVDIVAFKAEDREDADTWDLSNPFEFAAEVKYAKAGNRVTQTWIPSLVKDMDRLLLLERYEVSKEVAMFVAADPEEISGKVRREISSSLDSYEKMGLRIMRHGC